MTEEEFEDKMNRYELDQEYAEYISECRPICNGDQLIYWMERGDYYDDFKEKMVNK
jgi:hypothetical protein